MRLPPLPTLISSLREASPTLLGLSVLALLAAGCAGGDKDAGGDDTGGPTTDCSDGEDDDGDGLIDLDAPGCTSPDDDSELGGEEPACDDGVDNDGDGLIDFPADPGCFSMLMNSEADDCPDGAGCPQCGNGVDDDLDGATDFPDDYGCAAASDDQEATSDPSACAAYPYQALPPGGEAAGVLEQVASQISSTTCGGAGPEVIYEIYVPERMVLVATTDFPATQVNTTLYLRERCGEPETELGCNDDADASTTGSSLTVAVDPGYYYLIVDGRDLAGSTGAFQLEVALFPGLGSSCDPEVEEPCAPGLVCRTVPGAGAPTCEEPVCSDGRDDDEDGHTDFPDDPGCTSDADADEADDCPDGASCPDCANGVDDDADGQTDFPDDTGCTSAGQIVEGCGDEEDAMLAIAGAVTEGSTAGAHDDFDPACGSSGGAEVVHFLTLPVPVATLDLDTDGSAFDTLLYVDTVACDGAELGCDDDGGSDSGTSALTLSNLAAGTYAVFVDGYNTDDGGDYTLTIHGVVPPETACTDPLFSLGVLSCPSTHPCDGSICAPPACGNDVDEDGDGWGGYPDDPGCLSELDATEEDACPTGGSCPACGNDVDDDGDGLIDYPADPNCSAASDATEACADTDPIGTITAPITTGTTSGLTGDFSASCASTGSAPDKVYTLTVPVAVASLRVAATTSFDAVLMLKTAACGTEDLACEDDAGSTGIEQIAVTDLAAGSYALVVDGYSTGSGTYSLDVHGTVAAGAACTSPLFDSGVLACPSGQYCNGTACTPTQCADAIDQDGDGWSGYPADPGCTSTEDASEADDCPDGPNCPQCANDVDDDGDHHTDYPNDPSCPAASTDDESGCASASDPAPPLTAPQVTGNLDTEGNDLAPSCVATSGRDVAYLLDVPYDLASLYVDSNGSSVNTVLAVRAAGCTGADLACDDSSGNDQSDAALVLSNVAAGRYAVIVDSTSGASGAYTLNVRGVIDEGDRCDPADDAAGLFSCAAHTRCAGAAGAETCVPMACANGVDDDGDGDADALDPGCLSLADATEADPASAPQCANTSDDDADGYADYPGDPGCRRAADDLELVCAETTGVTEITSARVTGSTAGTGDNFDPGCAASSAAPERVYAVTVPGAMSTLTFDASFPITGSYDSVLYVRRDQCATDVACSDTPKLTLTGAPAGTYFVFVDGWSTYEGSFKLGVYGTIAAGAACDPAQIQAGMFACAAPTRCVANVCQ